MSCFYIPEPKEYYCPKCGTRMDWHSRQGRLGGWECPKCGLEIDKK